MSPSLLTIVKVLSEEKRNIEGPFQVILTTLPWVKREEGRSFMGYKEICSLCKGSGYITVVVTKKMTKNIDYEKDEIKQCWLCESNGEKECDTNTQ